MGKIFTLTDDIKKIAQYAIDDLIEQLGKTCSIVYPAAPEPCENCVFDAIAGVSANIWRTGGPMPFHVGSCPMCNGQGLIYTEKNETVKFLCQWQPRAWFIAPGNIRIPDGYVQIKGYITDLPKVRRAEYILMQTPVSGYTYFKYKLDSEPIDQGNIIQNRYFIALLRRYTE